jgi:N-acyl-D-amino-acid deacylase
MLIKNGTIIDGTKKERLRGDIRIEGERIKEIGNLKARGGERVIDASDDFVAPGFIDIINRSDVHFSIFERSGLRSLLAQGITTILGGSCGSSLAPLANTEAFRSIQKWQNISGININWVNVNEFLDEAEAHNPGVNFATLTGHATLRRGMAGDQFAKFSEDKLKKMEYLLARSIDEGSFGFSTGLAYSHERIATPEEVERLVKITKDKGGIYATHLRDEGTNLISSINETIEVSKKIDISSHIFHFKALGGEAWSQFPRALEQLANARERAVDITFDIYPYTKTASVLYLLLPDWASHGGTKEVLKRLKDHNLREHMKSDLLNESNEIKEIVVARGDIDNTFIGKSLGDIAKNCGCSAIDALLNVILASENRITGFIPSLNAENLENSIKSNFGFIASDGVGHNTSDRKAGALVHPRSFGTFPRFLAKYIREKNLLSWEEAINKITSLPAEKIGLKKRGRIERGYFADIVVFNPKTIQDKATFKNPFQYSQGLKYVIVNGGIAFKKGKFQKKRYGQVLRK